MILLDTDHFSVLLHPDSPRAVALVARIDAAADPLRAITVVSVEEQFRGWMAEIHRAKEVARQVPTYQKLEELIRVLKDVSVVPFDAQAADEFIRLRRQKIRIGTMDLKIAAIALVNDALLLTANRRDFARVPGLRFENWLDSPR